MEEFQNYTSSINNAFEDSEIANQLLTKLSEEGLNKFSALESVGTLIGVKAVELGISQLPKFNSLAESTMRMAGAKAQDFLSDKMDSLEQRLKSGIQSALERKPNVYNKGEEEPQGRELDTFQAPETQESATLQTTTIPDDPISQDEALDQISSMPRVDMTDPDLYPEGSGGGD
jgi:hypothetical protein